MYNVRGADGRLYGPADEATLRQWAAEGRIQPSTMLVDTVTNRELPANEIPGLFTSPPPNQNWTQPPSPYPRTQSPYGATAYTIADQEMRTGWTYFWVGIIGLFCCPLLAFVMFPLAWAQSTKAKKLGHPGTGQLTTASIVLLFVSIVWFVFGLIVQFAFLPFFGSGF